MMASMDSNVIDAPVSSQANISAGKKGEKKKEEKTNNMQDQVFAILGAITRRCGGTERAVY
jgi:hypothetical protein